MATNFTGIKKKLDLPVWEHLSIIYTAAQAATSAPAGSWLIDDKRASQYKNPNIWYYNTATQVFQYNTERNGFLQLASPALAGTFAAGACGWFAPSLGPRGTIAAGATTTTLTLGTALIASVGINQLKGTRIRIIGNNAGGSGKVEERTIVDNTSGTTPVLRLDSALSFTPGTNSGYEILSGRVYVITATTLATNSFKFFDVATSTWSASQSITNLPASLTTDSAPICLDELHTPIVANGVTINGEVGGYFGTLTATAAGATTLTGTVAGADSTVLANEYRNFQIRIVEDTVNVTAAGQRRRITSHTAGASPVYTVPTWTVTPSANAKFMIENNNDVILRTTANTTTYRYEPIGNTWDTSTYGSAGSAVGAGCVAWHPFNRTIDTSKNARYSVIYLSRGGGVNIIDQLDISAATTGTWSSDIAYDNKGLVLFNTAASAAYDPISNKTILVPFTTANTQPNAYVFDNDLMSLGSYTQVPVISSTPGVGSRLAIDVFVDGTDKKSFVYFIPPSQNVLLRSLIFV